MVQRSFLKGHWPLCALRGGVVNSSGCGFGKVTTLCENSDTPIAWSSVQLLMVGVVMGTWHCLRVWQEFNQTIAHTHIIILIEAHVWTNYCVPVW